MIPRLRIFISSPGDVAASREIAVHTIERLAHDYARHIGAIEPYVWQHEAMLASGHFQDSIEPPSAFDIVVLILWSRLGSPLPERTALREYRGLDGRTPVTGTEWEYEEALVGARARGTPSILVFRSQRPAMIDTQDRRRRDAQVAQLEALDAFWARHFADEARFLGAYTRFAADDDFASALENQLRKLIDQRLRLGVAGADAAPRIWTQAPFRGLEAYEFEHSAIFFGQDHFVSRAMLQLTAAASAGSPFLLVLGASGSGKSSLVKAGVAPKLNVPRRVTGAAFPRRAIFRPGDARDGEDLFDALARRLTSGAGAFAGLPELVSDEVTAADLAAHLRGGGREPALPFRLALGGVGAAARRKGAILAYETARLVLIVDQLEELFTDERITLEARRRFIDLMAGLSRSGLVWIVATMRKDFWHRVDETPQLAGLAEGPGRLELLPPTPAQISVMIRRPAEAVGVAFEVHPSTGIPLSEAIAEAVARETAALPLLSYLLDQLYRRDVLGAGGASLTYDTYERLGRLEGAIATRAEAVLEGSPAEDRDALGPVLFALIQISLSQGDVARATSRRAPLAVFPAGSPRRRLVEALLAPDARLLVTDAENDEQPTVRLAHEALITRWERARAFVRDNAEALVIRRRIEERHALWRGQRGDAARAAGGREAASWAGRLVASWSRRGREAGLLSEIDLADGRRLLRDHRSATEAHLIDYIERSIAEGDRIRDRAVRTLALISAGVTALAVIASVAAMTARLQTSRTLRAQARLLTEAAAEHLAASDVPGAEAIILEVLKGRPFGKAETSAAISVLEEARAADLELAVLSGHDAEVESAAFSPDGRRIVTASDDGSARLWDGGTGARLGALVGHGAEVLAAAFSPDGSRVVTASQDGTARIWDAATGRLLRVLSGHAGAVDDAVFSPDGRLVLTASRDRTARLWNAADGAPTGVIFGHDAAVTTAVFSSDGRRILTASADRTARVWDAVSAAPITVLRGHDGTVNSAVFSRDGGRIVTASADKTARVWDAATGAQLSVLAGHGRSVYGADFSPDGRRIVTASGDKTARIWDAATTVQIAVLSGHTDQLMKVAYAPDGRRIVTASQDHTARVWDAATGGQILLFAGHGGAVVRAVYAPGGARIATASSDKTARVWDARTGARRLTLSGHTDALLSIAMSPDGRRIATTSLDRGARVWDAESGARLAQFQQPGEFLLSAAFSPDGRQILTATGDGKGVALVWDAATGARLATLTGLGGQLYDAAYSPDGRLVVTASSDRTARVWDLATRRQVAVLRGHGDDVASAEFSPDGRRVVTASLDRTARIWDAATGAPLGVLSGHGDVVYSAAYSPDGRLIVTASNDRTARIWDAATGEQLAILAGHGDSVYSARFSPDGTRIVTASFDRTVRVWDARALSNADVEIKWAKAAQTDALSGLERARLGLPPLRRPSRGLVWRLAHGLVGKTVDAAALGRLAGEQEISARAQDSRVKRNALLLAAAGNYAHASAWAEAMGWSDDAWRQWRYRRATLVRVLAREGLIREAADACARAAAL